MHNILVSNCFKLNTGDNSMSMIMDVEELVMKMLIDNQSIHRYLYIYKPLSWIGSIEVDEFKIWKREIVNYKQHFKSSSLETTKT